MIDGGASPTMRQRGAVIATEILGCANSHAFARNQSLFF
jgi:hypothetical protein